MTLRNFDLDKTLTVRQVLDIVNDLIPSASEIEDEHIHFLDENHEEGDAVYVYCGNVYSFPTPEHFEVEILREIT